MDRISPAVALDLAFAKTYAFARTTALQVGGSISYGGAGGFKSLEKRVAPKLPLHWNILLADISSGHGFCRAEHTDFTDIQETGLIGSLERMGTREAPK